MAKCGRKPVLDQIKMHEIVAILTVGCSRRTAASYVGCAHSTISNTAQRDPEFAERLRRADRAAEIGFMKSIQKAADKEQYWRAAAWALERINPDEYAVKRPNVLTVSQVVALFSQLTRIVIKEVPVAKYRKRLIKRINLLIEDLDTPARAEKAKVRHGK